MKSSFVMIVLAFGGMMACKPAPAVSETTSKPQEGVAAKPYPLDVCLVSGEKLGSMGEPVIMVKDGQQIKFCCEKCQPEFETDSSKYLTKLAERR